MKFTFPETTEIWIKEIMREQIPEYNRDLKKNNVLAIIGICYSN
jgi:hypothetical protein